MIVAYDNGIEEFAQQLKKYGFKLVHLKEGVGYDAYIYKLHTTEGLLNIIDNNEKIFLLNIKDLTLEEAAAILKSHDNSSTFASTPYF